MLSQPTPSPPLSTTTSPSLSPSPNHLLTISDDGKLVPSSPSKREFPSDLPPQTSRTPVFPSREDCWSEDATQTLIDAWGSHYLELNRGNLRQNHWQDVAETVNAVHATTAKLRRTDVQCKNRLDTVKKKYKIEKSKVIQSNGRSSSSWTHFNSLDSLIGDSFSKPNNNTIATRPSRNLRRRVSQSPVSSPSPLLPPTLMARDQKIPPASNNQENYASITHLVPWLVPVGPRSKRSGPSVLTKRNFSVMAMAAAAAAIEAEDDEVDDFDDENWGRLFLAVGKKRKFPVKEEEKVRIGEGEGGYMRLAEAIARLGKIYEKVEVAKQRQMVESEKQRMQFAKDLDIQRMKVFMQSQIQLEKRKRAKHNSENMRNGILDELCEPTIVTSCIIRTNLLKRTLNVKTREFNPGYWAVS